VTQMTFRQSSADFTVQQLKFSNSDAQNTRLYFPPLDSCGEQTIAHRLGWPITISQSWRQGLCSWNSQRCHSL